MIPSGKQDRADIKKSYASAYSERNGAIIAETNRY